MAEFLICRICFGDDERSKVFADSLSGQSLLKFRLFKFFEIKNPKIPKRLSRRPDAPVGLYPQTVVSPTKKKSPIIELTLPIAPLNFSKASTNFFSYSLKNLCF